MKTKSEFKNWSLMQLKRNLVMQTCVLMLCFEALTGSAQTYTVLHKFSPTGNDGINPYAGLLLSGTNLYGTTYAGGYGWGTIFKINTDGSGYAILTNLYYMGGYNPMSTLVLSGTRLYGTASSGGASNGGTLFGIDIDGSNFRVEKNFGSTDGTHPQGDLVVSDYWGVCGVNSNGGFYGMGGQGTIYEGAVGYGSYYLVMDCGKFDGYYGAHPVGGVTQSGITLYWTTESGNKYSCPYGTVFSTAYSGTNCLIKIFTGSDGADPRGGLSISGATIYGTTYQGGSNGLGTVFRLNTDGSGFAVLKHFDGDDGANPQGTLVISGTNLYGTTYFGGSSNKGTVFMLNTDGAGFTVLKDFDGSDGSHPSAGLVLTNDVLYGTAGGSGSSDYGEVFSLSIAPPTIITPPQSQTVEKGCPGELGVDVTNPFAATYTWLFDDTNLFSCSTNNRLELTNCDFSQSGAYTVVVTNVFGAVTSAPVMLNVIPAVERRPVPAINLMGDAGTSLNVEYTDALGPLTNWLPLDSVNLTNPPQFCFDATAPLPPQRFYRAQLMNDPPVVAALGLHMVPAITLTGNVGDSLRLDYINAIGPTDAWVTLDTVTLTNTSQLYFDTSSIGQPHRLYRIVPMP